MRNLLLTLLHLAVMTARLCGPGGVRAVMAENLLLKQQLIFLRRARQRAPNLSRSDRLLCGFWSLFLNPGRIRKVAIALRPSTLLAFHQALVRRKYRGLFSSRPRRKKPGPKGPDDALIQTIVELKLRNPRFGCPRIARIISQTFGIDIDKNVVDRVLSKHYRTTPGGPGPSWLSFIGHTKDSLWSVDLFRCESIVLRRYWVLVVMDQFTRRLVGIGVHGGAVTGADVCRMFNAAIHGQGAPRHLSTDHDPLFEAHRWTANLRILEIDEIKTVPHVPLSHPFVERLIGTMRQEFLDHVLFWNRRDLQRKLAEFKAYYNAARCHASLEGHMPLTFTSGHALAPADLNHGRWVSHCGGLVQLPVVRDPQAQGPRRRERQRHAAQFLDRRGLRRCPRTRQERVTGRTGQVKCRGQREHSLAMGTASFAAFERTDRVHRQPRNRGELLLGEPGRVAERLELCAEWSSCRLHPARHLTRLATTRSSAVRAPYDPCGWRRGVRAVTLPLVQRPTPRDSRAADVTFLLQAGAHMAASNRAWLAAAIPRRDKD